MRNGNQGAIKMSYIEKFWRDATAADVARVMAGEVVEARFRDCAKHEWKDSILKGWQGHLPYKWITATGSPYCECQVYAPDQWWLDKPDPEEGYRLLGKEPDEPVQGGDFFKNTGGRWIELTSGCNPAQVECIWYRRKLEPKPEPKHYTLQVGDTISTPSWRQAIVTEHGIEVT